MKALTRLERVEQNCKLPRGFFTGTWKENSKTYTAAIAKNKLKQETK